MITISNSEINLWQRCKRQWFITYYLGFLPATEPAASKKNQGSRIHVALEGYYGYELDPVDVINALYAVELHKHPDQETELRAEWELSVIMVQGYLEWVKEEGRDADLEIVQVEADVNVPMETLGVTLRARMDQVFRRRSDGTLGYLDYKNVANFDKHELLALDPQMRYYSTIQRMATAGVPGAPQVRGGIITSLRRVKRTGASKPPYYRRDEFSYNPDMIESTRRKIVAVCTAICEARDQLDAMYQAFGGSLEAVNAVQQSTLAPTPIIDRCSWDCPFSSGLCTMLDDGSDWAGMLVSSGRYVQGDPYSYYRNDALRTLHAELEKIKNGPAADPR